MACESAASRTPAAQAQETSTAAAIEANRPRFHPPLAMRAGAGTLIPAISRGRTPAHATRRLCERALGRIERYPPRYAGVDAGPLRASLGRLRDSLDAGENPPEGEPPALTLSLSPRGDA